MMFVEYQDKYKTKYHYLVVLERELSFPSFGSEGFRFLGVWHSQTHAETMLLELFPLSNPSNTNYAHLSNEAPN
jgi:hypothetical protein